MILICLWIFWKLRKCGVRLWSEKPAPHNAINKNLFWKRVASRCGAAKDNKPSMRQVRRPHAPCAPETKTLFLPMFLLSRWRGFRKYVVRRARREKNTPNKLKPEHVVRIIFTREKENPLRRGERGLQRRADQNSPYNAARETNQRAERYEREQVGEGAREPLYAWKTLAQKMRLSPDLASIRERHIMQHRAQISKSTHFSYGILMRGMKSTKYSYLRVCKNERRKINNCKAG